MTYDVVVAPAAARQIKKLPKSVLLPVIDAIDKLSLDPFNHPKAKKLINAKNRFRFRAGDYRVIYEANKKEIKILILAVAHRREIYSKRF